MGRLKAGCDSRSGECGVYRACPPFGRGQSEDKPEFDLGQRAAAAEYIHRRAISSDRLGDARRGHPRVADRVRERDEHAVWPGRVAGKGTGHSRRARRDAVATRSANVDRSLVVAVFGAIAGVIIAYWAVDFFVRSINALPFPAPYYWKFTIDGSVLIFTVAITLLATIASGLVPAFLSARGNAAEMMKEGGRGNSSRLVNVITRVLVVGQIALTAALLIAATLANQIDPKSDEARLRIRRKCHLRGAAGSDGGRVSE